MKKIYEMEISKSVDKKISQLIKAGYLSRDKDGIVHGLLEHILLETLSPEPLESHQVMIGRKFLNRLAKKGTISFDECERVWWMEEMIQGLIDGKTLVEIGKERNEELKNRRH